MGLEKKGLLWTKKKHVRTEGTGREGSGAVPLFEKWIPFQLKGVEQKKRDAPGTSVQERKKGDRNYGPKEPEMDDKGIQSSTRVTPRRGTAQKKKRAS